MSASVTITHDNEYQATGQIVAAYVKQWQDGTARTAGLNPMGTLVDPERFLDDLVAAGFETISEPESA